MTEPEVRKQVESYLTESWFYDSGCKTVKEYGIQIGSCKTRADLVLIAYDKPIVIVECKHQGVDTGVDQLKSYLCASSVRLGIFANAPTPVSWEYYLKSVHNDFTEIRQSDFEKRVWKAITTLCSRAHRKRRRIRDSKNMHSQLDSVCRQTGTVLNETNVSINLEKQRVSVKKVENGDKRERHTVYRVRYDSELHGLCGEVLADGKRHLYRYDDTKRCWYPRDRKQ